MLGQLEDYSLCGDTGHRRYELFSDDRVGGCVDRQVKIGGQVTDIRQSTVHGREFELDTHADRGCFSEGLIRSPFLPEPSQRFGSNGVALSKVHNRLEYCLEVLASAVDPFQCFVPS
jgi:hypothetical protein